MKQINRGAHIITADSKQWDIANNDYMPGGLLTVTFERCRPFMEKKKIKIEKLGNQSALSLNYKGK